MGYGNKCDQHRKETEGGNKSHYIGKTFWKDARTMASEKILWPQRWISG